MSDKPPEQATEKVWLLASPELLAEILEQVWTRPVQIKVTPPTVPGASWEMEARDASPFPASDSVKMIRETLCVAQQRVLSDPHDSRRTQHSNRLQRLINECDRHRPLGPDGKHGQRHTATCGCKDGP